MIAIDKIYDQLFNYESQTKKIYYPIHKQINFKNPKHDLVDWMMDRVVFVENEFILDAGCGTGNTLFRLALEKGVKGLGVSLSNNEIFFANSLLKDLHLNGSLRFETSNYDVQRKEKFDKIIAIESLKHSEDIQQSIDNFLRMTKSEGSIIIADDFLIKSSKVASEQIRLWNAPSFITLDSFLSSLKNNTKVASIKTYDFTSEIKDRSKFILGFLIAFIFIFQWCFYGNTRLKVDTYYGGLLLEWLYKTKNASYNTIIITKK